MNYKILVVDDEPINIRLLERMFNRQYQVLCAFSGQEALERLKQHDVALIISDQKMPGMNGIEFLKLAAVMRPRVIRIVISGYSDVNVLTEAINSGVIYRFIAKPWNNDDLHQTVGLALEHFEIIKRQHELEQTNERLTMQMASMRRLIARMNTEFARIDDDTSFIIENSLPPVAENTSNGDSASKENGGTVFESEQAYTSVS